MDGAGAAPWGPPQRAAWRAAWRDVEAATAIDSAYASTRSQVLTRLGLLQRGVALRVKSWVAKLDEETDNVAWKRNRNAHARLLLEQLRAGRLEPPFAAAPPGGPLPTLPRHLLAAYAPAAASPRAGAAVGADTPAGRGAFSGGSQGGSSGGSAPRWAAAAEAAAPPSASKALDAYMGRHGVTPVRAVAFDCGAAADGEEEGEEGGAAPAPALPGTRVAAPRGAADVPQILDAGDWLPSVLELEARLGASAELVAELQWRLRAAEGALAARRAAEAEQQERQAPASAPAYDRRQVDELLARARRARGGEGPPRTPPPPAGFVTDAERRELLARLEAFRAGTDGVLRRLETPPPPAGRGLASPAAAPSPSPPGSGAGGPGARRPRPHPGALRAPIGLPVRHTAKSASMAEKLRGLTRRRPAASPGAAVAAPLAPRNARAGAGAGLLGEIADLRHRLVASLAVLEGAGSPAASDCGAAAGAAPAPSAGGLSPAAAWGLRAGSPAAGGLAAAGGGGGVPGRFRLGSDDGWSAPRGPSPLGTPASADLLL